MKNITSCAIVVCRQEDLWEGSRTALGLAAHNYAASLFVLGFLPEVNAALAENLNWLMEMGCSCYSDILESQDTRLTYLPFEDLTRELQKADLAIPFGVSGTDAVGVAGGSASHPGMSNQALGSREGSKTMLHIEKSQPANLQDALISALGLGTGSQRISLFDEAVDYDRLVDLIFDYGDVVTWW